MFFAVSTVLFTNNVPKFLGVNIRSKHRSISGPSMLRNIIGPEKRMGEWYIRIVFWRLKKISFPCMLKQKNKKEKNTHKNMLTYKRQLLDQMLTHMYIYMHMHTSNMYIHTCNMFTYLTTHVCLWMLCCWLLDPFLGSIKADIRTPLQADIWITLPFHLQKLWCQGVFLRAQLSAVCSHNTQHSKAILENDLRNRKRYCKRGDFSIALLEELFEWPKRSDTFGSRKCRHLGPRTPKTLLPWMCSKKSSLRDI